MDHHSLKMDQLMVGLPLLYHQNALSYLFKSLSTSTFPTQLVYPDQTISIGLNAKNYKSLSLDENPINNETEPNDETSQNFFLYTSLSADHIINNKLHPFFFKSLICSLLQISISMMTIAIQNASSKEFYFLVPLIAEFSLLYCIYKKRALFSRILQIIITFFLFTLFFTKIYSIFDLIILSGYILKLYCHERMSNLIIPHLIGVPK